MKYNIFFMECGGMHTGFGHFVCVPAARAAKHGLAVPVFEALHALRGVLVDGIPEFRLHSSIVEEEKKIRERAPGY